MFAQIDPRHLASNKGHESLMKEQGRSAKSRSKGEKSIEQRKWPTIVSQAKARRGEETSGRKKKPDYAWLRSLQKHHPS